MSGVPYEIRERLFEARLQSPGTKLFALVDGLKFELHYGRAMAMPKLEGEALFAGTQDAHLAHAGPWLVDVQAAEPRLIEDVGRLEGAEPSVAWLMCNAPLSSFANAMRRRLYAASPDGEVILRFWDPRVLIALADVLRGPQRQEFFKEIVEWHVLDSGQRKWIAWHDHA